MTKIQIKRVYEEAAEDDGYRVLVDRLWPRGMKKEYLKYNDWEKDITPSSQLRKWFHENLSEHWEEFAAMYRKELSESDAVKKFLSKINQYDTVTLLYASKEPVHNHARILQQYLESQLDKGRKEESSSSSPKKQLIS